MYTVVGAVRTRTFRVLWALEELGQPYDHITAGPQTPEARAHSPWGKIPILKDGAHTLTDSVAIMTYLADKHGGLTAPAGTAERAQQDAETLWLLEELDAALWMAARHTRIIPEDQRVPEIVTYLKSDFAKKLDILATRIKGPFLMGEMFTIADILAVHCLNWAIGAGFPTDNDTVNAYAKSIRARDAFKRVRALGEG